MVQNKQQTEKEPSFIRGLNAFAGKDVTAMSSAERLVFMTYIQQYKEARGLDNLAHDPQISPALREKIEYAVKKYREDEKQYVSVGQRDLELAIQREQQMQYMSEKEFQNFMREFEARWEAYSEAVKKNEELTDEFADQVNKESDSAKTLEEKHNVYKKAVYMAGNNEAALNKIQKKANKEGLNINVWEIKRKIDENGYDGSLTKEEEGTKRQLEESQENVTETEKEVVETWRNWSRFTPEQKDEFIRYLYSMPKKEREAIFKKLSPAAREEIERIKRFNSALNQYEASSEAAISLHNQKTRTASSSDVSPNVGEVGTVFNGEKQRGITHCLVLLSLLRILSNKGLKRVLLRLNNRNDKMEPLTGEKQKGITHCLVLLPLLVIPSCEGLKRALLRLKNGNDKMGKCYYIIF